MFKLSSLSLRSKFLLMIGFLLIAAIFTYLILAVKLFNSDKTAYIYESNASLVETLSSETNTIFASSIQTVRLIAAAHRQQNSTQGSSTQQLEAMFHADENLVELRLFNATEFNQSGMQARPVVFLQDPGYLDPYNLDSTYYNRIALERPVTLAELSQQRITVKSATLPEGAPLLAVGKALTPSNLEPADFVAVFLLRQDRFISVFSRSDLYSTYLVDHEGFILAHRDVTVAQGSQRIEDHRVYNAIMGSPARSGALEYRNQAGQEFILSFSKLPMGSLSVVSEIEKEKAFHATKAFIEKSILFALLVFFIAIIVSILFTKHLTAALKRLYLATVKIAGGDLSERVQVTSEDEVGFLSHSFNKMADQIVMLLKATAEKTKMEQELNTAKMVQATFFPKMNVTSGALNISGHYQPASQCGGDWWGHISTKDGRELVIIADAMGHGVPAALVTAMAYSSCATLADMLRTGELSTSPSQILDRFNRILYQAVRGQISMTFFVAAIDLNRGELCFANAGHNFPILIPKDVDDERITSRPKALAKTSSRVPISLSLEGVPLGIDEFATYEEKTIPLSAGDKLLMYTDGLIECESNSGRPWGRKQMLKSVLNNVDKDVNELKDLVLQSAFNHFRDEPIRDDITLVVASISKDWRPQRIAVSA